MTRFSFSLLVTLLVAAPLAAQEAPAATPAPPPTTPKDQASYSIGLSVGKSLLNQGLNGEAVNPAMLARGIIDALTNAKPALTQEQAMEAMRQFELSMQTQQKQLGDKAKAEGEAYLTTNSRKPDVKVLPSGLQYKVIKSGTGSSPKESDMVKVHYHGTLISGQKFDSSVERGEPAEFAVNEVIPGWTEALQLMKVGDKWQLFIPAKLAYGERGAPPVIPPNSVLVFEVELLEVQK